MEIALTAVGLAFFYLGLRDITRSQVRSGGRYAEKVEMMPGSHFVLAVIQTLTGLVMALAGGFAWFKLTDIDSDTLRLILIIGVGTYIGTFFIGMLINFIRPEP